MMGDNSHKKVIGITGSIATGKSTVTKYLRDKGYVVIDSDYLAYLALTKDMYCISLVKENFDCLNSQGNIDRKKLGQIIFHDSIAKEKLESIIHPYVIKEIQKEIESNHGVLFLDIPLLYESHLEFLCNQVVVVYLPIDLEIKRLMKRDTIDEKYARIIINNQMSIEEKRKRADIILDNSQEIESLYQQIEHMLGEI